MSNFKTYLQSLVDAVLGKAVQKTETSFITYQGGPSNTVVNIDSNADSYTAVNDGYVYFRTNSTSAGTWINLICNRFCAESPIIKANGHVNVSTRVSKGSTVYFKQLNGSILEKKFVQCLGGGDS